jgi:DNA-directed RNA polymerase subunit RPC12/RpoP
MAEAITIACPECDKKINVAADAVGKKIRCKACEHVFVIEAPAGKKADGKAAATKSPAGKPAAAKAAEAKKAPAVKATPPKPKDDDDDEDGSSNPYGVTSLDTSPRCPDCANELESEDSVICLHCGYNTRTRERARTRAVEDVTGATWFWWLLPGILCALATLILFTFDIWYSFKIDMFVDPENDWFTFISYPWFKIWIVWAPSVILMVGTTTFAVKRLILNPRPPEREKKKKKEAE